MGLLQESRARPSAWRNKNIAKHSSAGALGSIASPFEDGYYNHFDRDT